ncbi:MAG: ABC transporter transmembrane domain-containing protein, partial [Terriglobales bacterium]
MREFSRLLRFTGRYWGAVAAAMLLMIAVGALEGIFALLVAPVINTVLRPHGSGRQIFFFHANGWIHHSITLNQFIPTWFSHNPASVVLGALVLAVVLKGFAEYGGGYLINFVGFGVVTDVRNALYEKLIHQSAAFFQRHTTAKLMSTAINDIDR